MTASPSTLSLDRPANPARNLFHLGSGVAALLIVRFVPEREWLVTIAATLAATAWTFEASRRFLPRWNDLLMAAFGPVAHAHERHHVNSGTWYCTAMLVLALVSEPLPAALGVMVLGAADPVAAQVGRRFGQVRIRRNRTLEGTGAFFLTAFLTSLLVLGLLWPGTDHAILVALLAAGVGAVAELVSGKIDDNLLIPLAVAGATSLLV